MFGHDSSPTSYTHDSCSLVHISEENPVIDFIDSGTCITFRRWFRKKLIIHENHPRSLLYYRSTATRRQEAIRHLVNFYNTIHPFSVIKLYWEIFMFFLFVFMQFVYIYSALLQITNNSETVASNLKFVVDCIYLFDLILNFFVGYYDSNKSKTILKRYSIAKNYLCTFFLIDLLSLVPWCIYVMEQFGMSDVSNIQFLTLLKFFGVIRFLRLKRWLDGLELLKEYKQYSSYFFKLFKSFYIYITIVSALLTCAVIIYCNVNPKLAQRSIYNHVLSGTMMVLLIGHGLFPVEGTGLTLVMIFFILCGVILQLFLYTQCLQIYNKFAGARIQNDKLVQHFTTYMKYKGLSRKVRERIWIFFKFKYQNMYYNENQINYLLSENIKRKMKISALKKLIKNNSIFKDLNQRILNRIIAKLKNEIFLQDDVIIDAKTKPACMYFIYIGTVAVYDNSGWEIQHLEDGDNFGDILLLFNETSPNSFVCVTAVELLKLQKSDLFEILNAYPNEKLSVLRNGRKKILQGKGEQEETISIEFVIDDSKYRKITINPIYASNYMTNKIITSNYTWYYFLPKFLYLQFSRFSNLLFLLMIFIQNLPNVSPINQFTTLIPLSFILLVAAVKEIFEDWRRHKDDDVINSKSVLKCTNKKWKKIRWDKILVGDIVKIKNNDAVPADMLIFSTSLPANSCFIETSNLDGESNLKARIGLSTTSKLTKPVKLSNLSGTIYCDTPNKHLHQFDGYLIINDQTPQEIGPSNILLRGAKLRNTPWVIGCVIYTGKDTKLYRNTLVSSVKASPNTNTQDTMMLVLGIILVVLCLFASSCNIVWEISNRANHYYLGDEEFEFNFLISLARFFIIFSFMVPISLQVTLEFLRWIQSIIINKDKLMCDNATKTYARVRSMNLNAELGQVKYIFSDKTGTLTKNKMTFKKCVIGGVIYEEADIHGEALIIKHLLWEHKNMDLIREMLILLCICHSVVLETLENGDIIYHASSTDEKALILGAQNYGYFLKNVTPQYIEIDALGVTEKYEILYVLEFTSDRKRMSVIVRNPKGQIKLYCKGADSEILKRLRESELQQSEILLTELDKFAKEGLRVLCCAYADIDDEFYERWMQQHLTNVGSSRTKKERYDYLANLMERNLKLIGATVVEDQLQEGVQDTIASLLQAGIQIWILTGDKQETAITVGFSCGLVLPETEMIILNQNNFNEIKAMLTKHYEALETNLSYYKNACLLIDGKTLTHALSFELKKYFIKVTVSCKAVICCRMSPIQKSEIVECIRNNTGYITLAIGDGGNDVAMIQKADIGIGISGAEGLQAVNNSDFSISQFRFLLRLLLVHGARNYYRICNAFLYSIYKSIVLTLIMFWYNINCGFSGQSVFNSWSLVCFNVIFTSSLPFAVGIIDKPYKADSKEWLPNLYQRYQRGELLKSSLLLMWIINALVQSIFIFALTLFAMKHDILWQNGKSAGIVFFGSSIYTYLIVIICLKGYLLMNYFTWLTHVCIWCSIISWFIFILVCSILWPILPTADVSGMHQIIFTSVYFWIGLIFIPVITLVPDVLLKMFGMLD